MELNKVLIASAVVIACLLVFNLLIFLGVFDSRMCIQVENYNVYVCGKHNPVQEIKDIIKNSYHLDVVFESDLEPTQRGSFIAKGILALASQLSGHDLALYGIQFKDGKAMNCSNKMNLTLEQCQNFQPTKDAALIYVKYPEGGSRSEIEINSRMIYFKAHTSTYLENLVNVVFAYIINS